MTTTIIATYRLPRENGQPSEVLSLLQAGDTFTFAGGRTGRHTLTTTDRERVRAHWAGYVSNNRGRATKPAAPRFQLTAQEAADRAAAIAAAPMLLGRTIDLTADGIDITTSTELRALQAQGNLERRAARKAARLAKEGK